jgi:hypothetical protein
MGIITQSRYHTKESRILMKSSYRGASPVIIPTTINDMGVAEPFRLLQTTTSFRSGPKYDSSEDSLAGITYENQLLFSSSQYDTGHAFFTKDTTLKASKLTDAYYKNYANNSWFRGPMVPNVTLAKQAYTIPGIDIQYGTRAIARALPTNSVANLSNDLAEIAREGFPRLPLYQFRDKVYSHRELGGDYLNLQFGWNPLIQSVLKTLYAVVNAPIILEQYHRDSGRNVRRSRGFEPIISNKIEDVYAFTSVNNLWSGPGASMGNPTFSDLFYTAGGSPGTSFLVNHSLRQDYWFSGAFTYFLNINEDLVSQAYGFAQEAEKLLGLGVTPEVLYNLTPWTWLFDWFANIGDIIHNATAFSQNNLVMRYGYLMRKTTRASSGTVSGISINGKSLPPILASYTTVQKERVKATPYGFGLNPDTFSNGQWAILAALGMTKAPRVLY